MAGSRMCGVEDKKTKTTKKIENEKTTKKCENRKQKVELEVNASQEPAEAVSAEVKPKRVPDDSLMFVQIPSEMRFACRVQQDHQCKLISALLDTGCGAGYLVGGALGFSTKPACYSVSMVDGSVVDVVETVEVQLTVGEVTEAVTLRVMPNGREEPYILFGRQLREQFAIGIEGNKVTQGGEVLRDVACLLQEFREDVMLEDLDSCPDPGGQDSSDRVQRKMAVEEELRACALLEEQFKEPVELPFCPGAVMEFRRLSSAEACDTSEQQYCFELSLPPAPVCEQRMQRNRCYSQALYDRLSDAHRTEFDSCVEKYVSAGWWTESTRDECLAKSTYTANVFPVCVEGKAMRLVSDFKVLNEFYPSSTVVNRIHHPLLLLRTVDCSDLIVGDAKSAFYRVRLKAPVWLTVGSHNFLCTRLAFGLSFGVEALRVSLGAVWQVWKNHWAAGSGFASLWIDDFFLTCLADLPGLLYLAGICGFEVPQSKFQEGQAATKLLGATIQRDGPKVSFICEDEKRRQQIMDLIAAVRAQVTKSNVFALAGVAAYDPAHLHPERRVVSDVLRMVIGKYRDPWRHKLQLSASDQQALDQLLAWLDELVVGSHCVHVTVPNAAVAFFRVETDASKFGYSLVIKFRSSVDQQWQTVHADAGIWKKGELRWHVNRHEAFALMLGMRTLAVYLDYLLASRLPNTPFITHVEVTSDSTTAVSWAKTGAAGPVGKHFKAIEWRQQTNLADAVQSELLHLQSIVSSISINHIAGEANVCADRLSRLLYREVEEGVSFGAFVFSKQMLAMAEDTAVADKAALVVEVRDVDRPLVDQLASDCFELPQLLYRVACMKAAWGGEESVGFDEFDCFSPAAISMFGRIVQRVAESKYKEKYVSHGGVWYYQEVRFTGEEVLRVVIPNHRSIDSVRELIVRYYHRKTGHRGYKFDTASLNSSLFYIEGLVQVSRAVNSKCLICARKNASLKAAYAMPVQTVSREMSLPAFSRVSIDFVHLRTDTLLSAICTDTGVLFLTLVNRADAVSAFEGLSRLSRLYCVKLRRIHSDNAQSLSKNFQRLVSKEWEQVEFSFRAPHASQQNPVERSHRELWSLLRVRKFVKAIDEDGEMISNETLEWVSSIANSRPLGVDPEGQVITPSLLAWGANWSTGKDKLKHVREFFYSNLFAMSRRRHLPNRNVRRTSVYIGMKVLFQHRGPATLQKDEFGHEVGTVVGVGTPGNTSSVVVKAKGKDYRVHSSAIIPLSPVFQSV